jgi:uncharacterized protein YbaR (Trm112 family)
MRFEHLERELCELHERTNSYNTRDLERFLKGLSREEMDFLFDVVTCPRCNGLLQLEKERRMSLPRKTDNPVSQSISKPRVDQSKLLKRAKSQIYKIQNPGLVIQINRIRTKM